MTARPKPGTEYFYWLREWASHNSDGCTKVPDVWVICCWQHDFGCRMGFDPRDYYQNILTPIGKVANATLLRQCFIASSKLHHLSPWAWTCWLVLISPFGAGVNKEWWLKKATP
jgi:hypothetical protein